MGSYRRERTRRAGIVVLLSTLAAPLLPTPGPPGVVFNARSAEARSATTGAATGSVQWVQRHNGPGNNEDRGKALAASPNGSVIYAAGSSSTANGASDWIVFAYATSDGAQLWVKRFQGSGSIYGQEIPHSIAVSPDGSSVYVHGVAAEADGKNLVTIAYRAATGDLMWTRSEYGGVSSCCEGDQMLGVSPDGSVVYATGAGTAGSTAVAYNASTGARIWTRTLNLRPIALVVSPTGDDVFVTGYRDAGSPTGYDYLTVAHRASDGARAWSQAYDGPSGYAAPGWSYDLPSDVAVSPDGATVFVTGRSDGMPTTDGEADDDYATVAYAADTGAHRWTQRYTGLGTRYYSGGTTWPSRDIAAAMAASVDGSLVYVTGSSGQDDVDYATIAYDSTSGEVSWTQRQDFGGQDEPYSLARSPDGLGVYVTGKGDDILVSDYGTAALGASTGTLLWSAEYDGPSSGTDVANSVVVSPDSNRIFVTGISEGPSTDRSFGSDLDLATVAYAAIETDRDDDGIPDRDDNCPEVWNEDQADSDGDAIGDACEVEEGPDRDDDGLSDESEISIGTNPSRSDTDEDGLRDSWEVDPSIPGAGFNLDTDADIEVTRDEVFGPYGSGSSGGEGSDFRPTEPYSELVAPPDPLRKDVYLELDWQDCTKDGNPTICPEPLGQADPMHHAPWIPGLRSTIDMFDRGPVPNPNGTRGVNLHIFIDESLYHRINCDTAASRDGEVSFGRSGMTVPAVRARRLAFRYVWSGHSTAFEDPSKCPKPKSWEILAMASGARALPRYDYTPFGDADVFGRDILMSLGPAWICPTWIDGVCRREGDPGMFPAKVKIDGEKYDLPEPVQFALAEDAVGSPREDDQKAVMSQLWGRGLAHLLGHSMGLTRDADVRNNPVVKPIVTSGGRVAGLQPQPYVTWENLRYAPSWWGLSYAPTESQPAPRAFSPERECTPWAYRNGRRIRPWPDSSHCARRP